MLDNVIRFNENLINLHIMSPRRIYYDISQLLRLIVLMVKSHLKRKQARKQ